MSRKPLSNTSDDKLPADMLPGMTLQVSNRNSTIPFPQAKEPQANSPGTQSSGTKPPAVKSQVKKTDTNTPDPRRPVTRARLTRNGNRKPEFDLQARAQTNDADPEIPGPKSPAAKKRRHKTDPWAPRKERQQAHTTYTCDICCEDKPKSAFISYVKVNHNSVVSSNDPDLEVPTGCFSHLAKRPGPHTKDPVCRDCITQSLSAKLEALGPDSLHHGCCGDAQCRVYWDAEYFHRFLSPEGLEAYNLGKFEMWTHAMRRDDRLIDCANDTCKAVGLLEPHRISPGLPQAEGYECKTRMCVDCRTPWHTGETCTEFRLKDLPDKLERGEKQVIAAYKGRLNVKRCPHCLMVAEKIDGCDGMVCPVCRSSFDWIHALPLELETRTETLGHEHGSARGCEADMSPGERKAARAGEKERIDPWGTFRRGNPIVLLQHVPRG